MLAGLVPITSSQRGGRQFFRTMRLPSCLIDYKIRRSKLRAKVKGTSSRCSHAVKEVERLAGDNEQRVKRRRKLLQVG